ncbi:hypothetical protein B0H13DRAFT_1886368 [Mycena leptocephala]|nr:hypothetical protein B0H13DRAFT_1886368 [Mycena leptocephala]
MHGLILIKNRSSISRKISKFWGYKCTVIEKVLYIPQLPLVPEVSPTRNKPHFLIGSGPSDSQGNLNSFGCEKIEISEVSYTHYLPGGAWPAWWSVGPSWPHMGEIDVLEGVHKSSTNKMTLHTSPSCIVGFGDMAGTPALTDCQSSGSNNQGCGVLDKDPTSYGEGFNNVGDGVYAHIWTKEGIKIWHFSRANVPADIIRGTPDPTTWGTPRAHLRQGTGATLSSTFTF